MRIALAATLHLEGMVVSADADGRRITVSHKAIPGVMPAMVMPDRVRDTLEVLSCSLPEALILASVSLRFWACAPSAKKRHAIPPSQCSFIQSSKQSEPCSVLTLGRFTRLRFAKTAWTPASGRPG